MKLILVSVALATLVESIATADQDGIQNATPIGIPLNNPSFELGGESNDEAAQAHGNKVGGYRPLYPPYFKLDRTGIDEQKQYYDQEYYSRGSPAGNFDSRLERTLDAATAAPAAAAAARAAGFAAGPVAGLSGAASSTASPDDVQVYVVNLDSQSQPESVVQLQSQPRSQLPGPPRLQAPAQLLSQSQIALQAQQYARQFSSFRTQHTHSYFYNFKFPTS